MSDSPSPDEERVRALLEDTPYIDDAGFSDRVARALPQRRHVRSISYTVVPAFATLGCVLAFALAGHAPPGHVAHGSALLLVLTSTFVALALALMLVASSALIAADE